MKKSENCDKKCTHKIRNKSVKYIVKGLAFDSARKARAIKRIIEETHFPIDKHGFPEDFFESYLHDIIDVRNQLAHSYSKINEGGVEVLVSKKDGQDIFFDGTKIKEIRQRILRYEKMLDVLFESVR